MMQIELSALKLNKENECALFERICVAVGKIPTAHIMSGGKRYE